MSKKNIEIRYFASVREALGKASEMYETQAATVEQLRTELVERGEPYKNTLQATKVLRSAVNQIMVDESVAIHDGDEVAFFPPVTGG